MNWSDYINKNIGKPWVNRSIGPDSFDCYGLLIHSFYSVDDIEIPEPTGYKLGEPIELCGNNNKSKWVPTNINEASAFACYNKSGEMVHVGRVTPYGLLHAFGSGGHGSVALHKPNQIERILSVTINEYSHLEFYRFDDAIN